MKVVIYDASSKAGWVGNSWVLGGRLYRALRKVDIVIPILLWEQVGVELQKFPDYSIKDLQFWSHGHPGGVSINGESVNNNNINPVFWGAISRKLRGDGRVWFRTCATFSGYAGHDFAKKLADTMDRTVVGHTYIIGPFQSGLHAHEPGREPNWSPQEGLEVRKDGSAGIKMSGPFQPNTVTCLHTDF
jgi:hypothetical protein